MEGVWNHSVPGTGAWRGDPLTAMATREEPPLFALSGDTWSPAALSPVAL